MTSRSGSMPSAGMPPAWRRSRSTPKAASGLIPKQPLGDRGGIDIEGRYVSGAPPLARWDEARKTSPHRIVPIGKAPNGSAPEPRVLVQRIERHAAGLHQRRDWVITDPLFAP